MGFSRIINLNTQVSAPSNSVVSALPENFARADHSSIRTFQAEPVAIKFFGGSRIETFLTFSPVTLFFLTFYLNAHTVVYYVLYGI